MLEARGWGVKPPQVSLMLTAVSIPACRRGAQPSLDGSPMSAQSLVRIDSIEPVFIGSLLQTYVSARQ